MLDLARRAVRGSLCASAVLLAACTAGDADVNDTLAVGAGDARAGGAQGAGRVAVIEGFDTPESVRYDPDQDVYFVSNINGNPSQKDNNGYIARVAADSGHAVTRLVEGGRNGATLHAPKGMAIVGDTLWVTDIDAVRGFNRRTGAPVATIEMPRPVHFLNDIAAGPDGALHVTDTGIEFGANGEMTSPGPNQIFRIGADRRPSVVASGAALSNPNGIVWDAARGAFIVAPFSGQALLSWTPGAASPTTIATGPGEYDGVEVVSGGPILVSSWADSSIHALSQGDSVPRRVVSGVAAPADIGVDTRRSLLAIPLFMGNSVELWPLPR